MEMTKTILAKTKKNLDEAAAKMGLDLPATRRLIYEERLAAIPSTDDFPLDTRLGPLYVSFDADYLTVTGEINYVGHRHYLNLEVLYEKGTWKIENLTLFDFTTGERSETETNGKEFLRAHGRYLTDLALKYLDQQPAIRREAMLKHLSMTLRNGLDLIDNKNLRSELDVAESGFRLANRAELAEAIAKVKKALTDARKVLQRAKSPSRRVRTAA